MIPIFWHPRWTINVTSQLSPTISELAAAFKHGPRSTFNPMLNQMSLNLVTALASRESMVLEPYVELAIVNDHESMSAVYTWSPSLPTTIWPATLMSPEHVSKHGMVILTLYCQLAETSVALDRASVRYATNLMMRPKTTGRSP